MFVYSVFILLLCRVFFYNILYLINLKYMKTNILTFLCFVFLCACQAPPVEEYAIIPQPQEITYTPGFFKMGNHPVISYSGDLNNEAGLLQKILSSDFSLSATVKVILTWYLIRQFYRISRKDINWKYLPEKWR